jgi:hypothetical protein
VDSAVEAVNAAQVEASTARRNLDKAQVKRIIITMIKSIK